MILSCLRQNDRFRDVHQTVSECFLLFTYFPSIKMDKTILNAKFMQFLHLNRPTPPRAYLLRYIFMMSLFNGSKCFVRKQTSDGVIQKRKTILIRHSAFNASLFINEIKINKTTQIRIGGGDTCRKKIYDKNKVNQLQCKTI